MRDPERIDLVLERLGHLWRALPDWRLSQVIVNALDVTAPQVFYAEDDRLLVGLQRLIDTYASEELAGERVVDLRSTAMTIDETAGTAAITTYEQFVAALEARPAGQSPLMWMASLSEAVRRPPEAGEW